MNPVEHFIESKNSVQKDILVFLHHWILGYDPHIFATIKYGIPFYSYKKRVCYLNPIQTSGVELVFIRANLMKNTQALLHFGKRKSVAGIVIDNLVDMPIDILQACMLEALIVDG